MKTINTKIITIGLFLGILFSLIIYKNFEHNIEEIIEAQEFRSNKLIENNIDIIFDKINTVVKNTLEISIDEKFITSIQKHNIQKINTFSLNLQKKIESNYDVSSIFFVDANKKILYPQSKTTKNLVLSEESVFNINEKKQLNACFAINDNESFYKIVYPVFSKNMYMGYFDIRLKNKQILRTIKNHINAEIALFVNENSVTNSKVLREKKFFEDYVVMDSTNSQFIELMLKDKDFSIEDNEEIFTVNGQSIEIDSIPLEFKNGEKILVLFHNVTETYESIDDTRNDFILYFMILLFIFLVVSYYIYYNSNKTINEQYNQLVLKKEESEKLLKVKSEFLANMSHEIRTPLNAINGFIDLIEEETKDSKILKYINTIQNSSKSLLHIIEDILDLSKIESGKMAISKIDFDTRSEFETIAYLFNTKASSKNILLTLNIDKDLPQYIKSDSLRIKQVVSNLIDNAIKFTDKGKKIIVDISYFEGFLNISVEDNGIGIEKNRQNKIFKPFTQADNSTTRKYGGTGLGLTISSQLIELLGGQLKLKSELGTGSKFYFSIPVEIGKMNKSNKIEERSFECKDKKILLVEDNKSNQLFMKVLLKKLELNYDIANDGLEAISYFNDNKYDLILMDENMPNMSGIEATKKIIEIEHESSLIHTPIIALTANALEGDREKFLEAGMDEYLSKPINKDKLNKILSVYFNK